jgi:hypothetical protein
VGDAEAKKNSASAEKWRRKRGRRGKKGQKGPEGPNGPSGPGGPTGPGGPPAGASVRVVNETCSLPNAAELGAIDGCEALCPDGYVAVGGGYQGPSVVDEIGHVVATRPVQNAQEQSVGWVTEVEYLRILGFSITTYAVCVPE